MAAPRHHHQPRIEARAARPYVAVRARAGTAGEFGAAVHRGLPAVVRWLRDRGLQPAGAPFVRYVVVDDVRPPGGPPPSATFELAVPLEEPILAGSDAHVRPGELPAGRWAVMLHRGGHGGLAAAHRIVRRWAAEEDVRVARSGVARGAAFTGCVEHHLSGPLDEPDPWRWRTDVAYLLVGPGTGAGTGVDGAADRATRSADRGPLHSTG